MLAGPHPDCHSTVVLHLRSTSTSGPDGRGHHAKREPDASRANHSRAAGRGEVLRWGGASPWETRWWRPGRIASCGSDDDRQEAA